MPTPRRPPLSAAERCKLSFICRQKWDGLAATANANDDVRHCGSCGKDVFRVSSEEQRDVAAVFNRCVAIDFIPEMDFVLGNPPRLSEWDYLSAPRSATVHLALQTSPDSERLEQLRKDYPVIFASEDMAQALLAGKEVLLGEFTESLLDPLLTDLAVRAPDIKVTVGELARPQFRLSRDDA